MSIRTCGNLCAVSCAYALYIELCMLLSECVFPMYECPVFILDDKCTYVLILD